MANIKELIQSIESGDSSFDEKLAAINQMEETLVAMKEHEAIDDNVELIIEALRTIEAKVEAKLKIIPEKGEQGIQGAKGEQGDRGLDGDQGKDGKSGVDGKDGLDGKDGVSVQDAKIDFDGSLVITLSDGREINVGEVVPVDVAQTIHKIQSGSGGDSQTTLNAIAALQATIATYGTMATQNANAVAITGGTINNTTVGATTPSTGVFTTLTAQNETLKGTGQNLLLSSSDYANAVWGVVSANVTRTTTTINFTNSFAYAYQAGVAAVVGVAYTFSVTLSSTNKTAIVIRLAGGSTGASNQSLITLTSTPTRYSVTFVLPSGNSGLDAGFDNRVAAGGDGSLGSITVSNAQLEIGSVVNTYIPTTTTAVYGTPTLSFSGVASIGLQSDGSLYETSAGTGNVRFYTNNIAQEQMRVSHTASAVNYVQVTGAATGGRAIISMQGSDTNIPAGFYTKGSGSIDFRSYGGSNNQFVISGSAVAVNYFQANGSITGFGPVLSAQGSDTNINAVVQPKGTGALQAQQTDSTATGGNARGARAVDWQTLRTAASQVASGFVATASGGYNNTVSGGVSVVGGGTQNTAAADLSSILGGIANSTPVSGAGNTYSFIGAGYQNNASGIFNVIGGGYLNSGTATATVTTQSGTMNGTTAVTLSGSNASIRVGQLVTGTSIQGFPNTYVAAISGTSLTLSQAASGSSTSTLSFYTPHGVVVGGGNNQATGAYSFIGGGGDAGTAANRNVASGDWSAVVGGFVNRATGKWSTAGGGGGNLASGEAAVVVGGGSYGGGLAGNTASSTSSFIGAGYGNTANGYCSAVVGGTGNVASNNFSFVGGGAGNSANTIGTSILGGYSGTTRSIEGMQVMPACVQPINTTQGTSQAALLILGRQTVDATATVLTSNTGAASTNNQVILPNNAAYYFKVEIIANVTGGGNTSGWELKGVIKRGANAASTAIVGSVTSTLIAQDAGASTWAVSATADTTNGGLKITCTGQASTTIRWVAKASTTEVTF